MQQFAYSDYSKTKPKAHTLSSNALVTSSIWLLVVMPELLVASSYYFPVGVTIDSSQVNSSQDLPRAGVYFRT